ncbi:MAG: polysaccharide biosynthesis C-terminal domain-containing protein [Magnetococcales bacterium]|nr:polysaccharide biosynthesis C-terminal domain-containing protein [Magnetococcales bacterium]
MKRGSGTLGVIVRYASSNFYRQILGLITAFLRPKLLAPEAFGLWSLFAVIPTYASHLHLGTRATMRFQVPELTSRGEADGVERLKGAVYRGSLFVYAAAALALALGALAPGLEIDERVALVLSAVTVLVGWHYEFHISLLKGRSRFGLVGRSNMILATTLFLSTVVLIPLWGVEGAFIAVTASWLLTALLLARNGGVEPIGPFHGPTFRRAVRTGLPIMLFDLVGLGLRNGDKLLVAALLGKTQLGYYGLAAMVTGALMNIPGVSREVTEPQLMASLQHTGPRDTYARFLRRPLLTTALLMPLLIGPVHLALEPCILLLLPDYQPGLESTRILTLATYFLALVYPTRGVLVAFGWQGRAVWAGAAVIAVNATLSWLLIRQGYGLPGVAWSNCAAFLVLLILLLGLLLPRFALNTREWGGLLLGIGMPFVIMIGALQGSLLLGSHWSAGHPHWGPVIALALYLPVAACGALAAWWLHKRS